MVMRSGSGPGWARWSAVVLTARRGTGGLGRLGPVFAGASSLKTARRSRKAERIGGRPRAGTRPGRRRPGWAGSGSPCSGASASRRSQRSGERTTAAGWVSAAGGPRVASWRVMTSRPVTRAVLSGAAAPPRAGAQDRARFERLQRSAPSSWRRRQSFKGRGPHRLREAARPAGEEVRRGGPRLPAGGHTLVDETRVMRDERVEQVRGFRRPGPSTRRRTTADVYPQRAT